ncbi:hypothetical protein FRC10_000854, partial [Ceratobasidium sp. 414]
NVTETGRAAIATATLSNASTMVYTDPWGKRTTPTAKSNTKRRPCAPPRTQTTRPQMTHLTAQIANTTKTTTSTARSTTNEDENPAMPEAVTENTQATAIEAATETGTGTNPQTILDAETVPTPQFKTIAGTATIPHKRTTTAMIATVDTEVTAVRHATMTAAHAAQTAGRDAGIHIVLNTACALLGLTMNGADLQGPPTAPRDHTMTVIVATCRHAMGCELETLQEDEHWSSLRLYA